MPPRELGVADYSTKGHTINSPPVDSVGFRTATERPCDKQANATFVTGSRVRWPTAMSAPTASYLGTDATGFAPRPVTCDTSLGPTLIGRNPGKTLRSSTIQASIMKIGELGVVCGACRAPVVLQYDSNTPIFNRVRSYKWPHVDCPNGHTVWFARHASADKLAVLNNHVMTHPPV